jgi:glutamate-5-semialdehyde dehydrogenase
MSAAAASSELIRRLEAIRTASRGLRALPSSAKNQVLGAAADGLVARQAEILAANAEDLAALPESADSAFRDRLLLDDKRLAQMVESIRQVAALEDPVGEVVERKTLSNGLAVRRVRSPLGVIFMIFESRPNVAIEAFSLAFKAGNAMILRGGKESRRTVGVLYDVLSAALAQSGVRRECLWGITDPDRALVETLLEQKQWIDVVVPRGGDGLIEFVTRASRIPVIKNDRGLCHVYVHEDADLAMAERIVVNAKCQRPGVCNSMETVLVHSSVAERFVPGLHAALPGVQWFGCPRTVQILGSKPNVAPASATSFDTEYLSLQMNCRIVDSFEDAIAHIERHGSRHSEAIITASAGTARRFEDEVDAAAVYWNASTRFTDGFELGLGGELGISTQKLHVRGPVGLRELTSVRWVIEGNGQTRN